MSSWNCKVTRIWWQRFTQCHLYPDIFAFIPLLFDRYLSLVLASLPAWYRLIPEWFSAPFSLLRNDNTHIGKAPHPRRTARHLNRYRPFCGGPQNGSKQYSLYFHRRSALFLSHQQGFSAVCILRQPAILWDTRTLGIWINSPLRKLPKNTS